MTDDWMKNYPSVIVTRSVVGDKESAKQFAGEGNKLLYQLKNQMTFNNLGQLKMTRQFLDGTVITAKSVFGHDYITIDVSGRKVMVEITGCCSKNSEDRVVEIWWEKVPEGLADRIEYNGKILYKIPDEVLLDDLADYTLYAIPEVKGGCIPFSWELTGVGSVSKTDFGTEASYSKPETEDEVGCEEVYIELSDLCKESVARVDAILCCDEPDYEEMAIEYTALMMLVSTQQTLSAVGGCPNFSWEILTGGGDIVVTEGNSRNVTFTAPATNPDCANNPTIRVTDCCGKTAEITISITNDHGPAYVQYFWVFQNVSYPCGTLLGPVALCYLQGRYRNCSGDWYDADLKWPSCPPYGLEFYVGSAGVCGTSCPSGAYNQAICYNPPICPDINGCCVSTEVLTDYCRGEIEIPVPNDGDVEDLRTPELIADGCCPINPVTGMPF